MIILFKKLVLILNALKNNALITKSSTIPHTNITKKNSLNNLVWNIVEEIFVLSVQRAFNFERAFNTHT